MRPSNNRVNLTVRPVTRLAVLAPPRITSKGSEQGARPSRPAGYAERYAVSRGKRSFYGSQGVILSLCMLLLLGCSLHTTEEGSALGLPASAIPSDLQHSCMTVKPLESDVTEPTLILKVDPVAPHTPTSGGRDWACAEVTVTPEGNLTDIRILVYSDPIVSQRVKHALSLWRYKPATRGGKPVAVRINVFVNV